jgi:hypothetical protein
MRISGLGLGGVQVESEMTNTLMTLSNVTLGNNTATNGACLVLCSVCRLGAFLFRGMGVLSPSHHDDGIVV